MNNKRVGQALSSLMKLSNLVSKFLLLIYLAKYTKVEDVAAFGLYWTALVIAAILIGLDVYSRTVRNILDSRLHIQDEVSFHNGFVLSACIILVPLAALLFSNFVTVPLWIKILFFFHIIIEVFNQELSRLLIPLNKQFQSSVINFLRGTVWIVFAVILSYIEKEYYIEITLASWFLGSVLAFVYGYFKLYQEVNFIRPRFNFKWIKISIKFSFVFFMSTLALRVVLGGDRFVVEQFYTKDILAVYIFYASIVFAVVGLIDAGISTWKYPDMIRAIRNKEKKLFYSFFKSFFRENFIFSFILIAGVILLVPIFIETTLDPLYSKSIESLYLMGFGVFLYSMSMPFHYSLYGNNNDALILLCNFLGVCSIVFSYKISFFSSDIMNSSLIIVCALVTIFLFRLLCFILVFKRKTW